MHNNPIPYPYLSFAIKRTAYLPTMKLFAALLIVTARILGANAEGGTRAMRDMSPSPDYESPEDFIRRLQTTDGGAGSCNLFCKNNSDCELASGDWNPCTKCGKDQGTRYYQRCYNKSEDDAGMCNLPCKKDSQCQDYSGWNECTACGEYVGTQYYDHCYNPDANPQQPAQDCSIGQCCKHCNTDDDCAVGGVNSCFSCGQYAGTQYYRRCYDAEYVGGGSD